MTNLLLSTIVLITYTSCVLIEHIDEQIEDKILNSFMDGSKKQLFKVYHHIYNKQYDLYSDEGLMRYKNFKDTLKLIKEINSKNLTYTLGINDFSDLSYEEFKDKYLSPSDETQSFTNYVEKEGDINYPTIDHTQYMTPVREQKNCGSCWAFATLATIEANYFKNFGPYKFYLSPQDLINCVGTTTPEQGCKGRTPAVAFNWIKRNGVTFDDRAKYVSGETGLAEPCREMKRVNMTSTTEGCINDCSRDDFYMYLARGPIYSQIAADEEFKSYKRGVFTKLCTKNVNHAVVIFAHKNGLLTGKNSWGTSWGLKGFFEINSPSPSNCFLERTAILPIVQKVNNVIPVIAPNPQL